MDARWPYCLYSVLHLASAEHQKSILIYILMAYLHATWQHPKMLSSTLRHQRMSNPMGNQLSVHVRPTFAQETSCLEKIFNHKILINDCYLDWFCKHGVMLARKYFAKVECRSLTIARLACSSIHMCNQDQQLKMPWEVRQRPFVPGGVFKTYILLIRLVCRPVCWCHWEPIFPIVNYIFVTIQWNS